MKKSIFKKNIRKKSLKIDKEIIKINIENPEAIVKNANSLLKNEFIFTRTWDMEPCHYPYKIDPINWLAVPNNDDEWTFMLNRFNYVEYLVMATIIEDDIKYMKYVKKLIIDWVDQHPKIVFGNSTRTLDTGMRINAWIDALVYLDNYGLISAKDFIKIEKSIITQIIYMKENYIPKYTLSNWGSIQTASIIKIIPLLSDFSRKETIYKWAIEEFERQMDLQVYDDGLHWEQSTMYHVEVLHYALKILDDEYYTMPSRTKTILYNMATALLYQMTPTGAFEAFGDSDISNLNSILNLCAVKFKENKFKVNNESITNMDNLYEMTKKQIDYFHEMTSNLPEQLNYDGFDSGMFTSRSGWTKNSNFTLFTNGTMGSGHAHVDNNHLSIYYKGKPIVIDSGRYTYREDAQERIKLKSAQAHSSVVIDGVPASIPSGSWTFKTYLNPLRNRVKHKGDFHYYEGTILSDKTTQLYAHTRRIITHDLGIWFIVDDVRSDGRHSMQTFFNIEPNVQIKEKNEKIHLDDLIFISLDEEVKINDTIYSPRYNKIEQSKQIELNSSFSNNNITKKMFFNQNYEFEKVKILRDKKEIVSDELGIAVKVSISAHHHITFVMIHEELYDGRKNLYCEGIAFHAKAIAIEEKNNEKKVFVLAT